MPAVNVSFESVVGRQGRADKENGCGDFSTVVATPLGLALVEIQGELSIPKETPAGLSVGEQGLFTRVPLPALYRESPESREGGGSGDAEDVEVVKFGRLELDEELQRATLFISTTQRLIGTVEKIDPPLGVLKVVHAGPERTAAESATRSDDVSSAAAGQVCEMIDVVGTKIIFKHRPLPIM